MISSAVDGPSVGNRQGSSLSVPKVRLGRSAPSADAALDRSRPSIDTWQRFTDRAGSTAVDRGYGGATPHAGRPTPSGPRNDAVERIERPDEDPALTTWLGDNRSKRRRCRTRVKRIRTGNGGRGGARVQRVRVDRRGWGARVDQVRSR